jgi:hypothetical protein
MLVALLGWAPSAGAQVLHQCTAPDGATSYQSAPCAAGSRMIRTIAVSPDPERTPADQARQAREQRRQQEAARYLSSLAGTDRQATHRTVRAPSPDPQRTRCEAARRQREETLRRVGLKRTFDLLRRLDDRVYEACRQ